MDAADLDYRARTLSGCVPPRVVSRLVELGHIEEVEFQAPVQLAELLVRHDRGDEATEVPRSLADGPGGHEDWIVHTLCTHYADRGRAEDGLAYLDTLKPRTGDEEWDFFRMRLR